ncbi:uncharacterized protein UHO2_06406 [Ustilago hordei]|uniref:uncharacterized protein n=1 Tax=Ustilago hordei TaxID=120017 RepID=UPI001A3D08B8|nr:uncharacterized protein UHO2_06406 [Ustilago hordei]SYW80944.1 uncharacterized protein UHO2_06406 [Ustilago hordei]
MTSSTDDSCDISAELLCQSTTPTSSATQTESVPVLSQSGSTSAPDIHTSCPTRASRSATGKKNLTWSGANLLHLVMILYNNNSYQHTLLPSRELAESDPALKLCKHPIFWDISKMIFPGASVDPNHIKSKLRWLLETYYREKKKLSLTGAGTLLEDMDASNLSYISRIALSTNLDFTSNDEPDMPLNGSADIPMDICGSELYNHSAHGHGLPPILNLIKPTNPPAAVASTSGVSFAGTAQLSPSTKCKRGALDHKHNTLAEAFYHSSIDTLQICLQLEQECTRHEKILEAEHTKHKEMHLHHEREEKECNECVCTCDHEMVMEMVHLLASQASVEQDACQNTSNNNNTDSSFNLPVL